MARIQNVEIAVADDNATGVVVDKIITRPNVETLIQSGASFCLKPISEESKPAERDAYFDEAHDVMNAGLKLMPLITIGKLTGTMVDAGKKHAKMTIDVLNDVGLPYGVTVWIDMQSLMDQISALGGNAGQECTEFLGAWSAELAKSSYGVGQYAGTLKGCCCPPTSGQGSSGSTVLELFQCPDGNTNNSFPSVTLNQGDNDACKIYWALMKSR